MKRLLHRPFFIRLLHWEYWNSKVVYAPLYPYWLWLSLKARSLYFLTAANPRIKNGGFIMERKSDVYKLLPPALYPTTLCFDPGTGFATIMQAITNAQIKFPLIAKPDIGERGLAVKKINNEAMLLEYITHIPVAFLIQEFVAYENEVGIFYCRLPGADKGFISGIVNKEPVAVTGDGTHTIAQLVRANARYLLQWKQINELNSDKMDTVPAAGTTVQLIPYGNHSRGSKFTDETWRANPQLNDAIDEICRQIPEFYYGRLDIRFRDWESMERGEHIAIIEVNGSGSEPTHIYDPGHSIFFAWREIVRHWKMLYAISKANNEKGTPYISINAGRKDMNSFRDIDALLSARVW